jgi:hypothetical protein
MLRCVDGDTGVVRWRELPDPTEEGSLGEVDDAGEQETARHLLIRFDLEAGDRQQGLDLRGEMQCPPHLGVVEGFDSEPVPGEQDRAAWMVEDRECPHADEPLEARGAPLLVGLEHHLGVPLGSEGVPEADQLLPQLDIVVDLTVVRDRVGARGIHQRLVAALAEVDDGEPPMGESDLSVADARHLLPRAAPQLR